MKKILVLVLGLFLVACGATPQEENVHTVTPGVTKSVKTVGEGESCGGAQNIKCGLYLECRVNVHSLDTSGICEDSVEEKYLECDKRQLPVCARKRNQKNAYLNPCEAKRHGAVELYDGFCKVDDITNDCEAEVLGMGNCEVIHTGYTKIDSVCVPVKVAGCEIETPFQNLTSCQALCE